MRFLIWLLARTLLRLRYRITMHGVAEASARGKTGILFLPNHPALVDPLIVRVMLHYPFDPCVLADRDRVDHPLLRGVMRTAGVIALPDPAVGGEASRLAVEAAIQACVDGLKNGRNVVVYPSGRTYRARFEDIRGNSAVETILEKVPEARIVLVRTRGLWGSRFGRAPRGKPNVPRVLRQCLWDVLRSGVFFVPKRKVTLELHDPPDFPRSAGRSAMNRYLEAFYNQDAPPNTYVPRSVWERGGTRVLPEPDVEAAATDDGDVPPSTRRLVMEKLAEKTGARSIRPEDELGRDLGMDSLATAEIAAWAVQEFGVPTPDVEAMATVNDLLLAAAGQGPSSHRPQLKPVPSAWFRAVPEPIALAEGRTLTEAFLRLAVRRPAFPVMSDQTSGVRTYRGLVTACLALRPALEAMEGNCLGIMLPASVGASVTFLAVHFAGKTPVMVNWTVGEGPMKHSLDRLEVKRVLTSRRLVQVLAGRGITLDGLAGRLVYLEDLGKAISLPRKLAAALTARFRPGALRKNPVGETAVVLFTSGSESLPKAVPLSHANILTNIADQLEVIRLSPGDRMLGFLPPFHSFGLTCTVVLPLCSGLQVAYHTNPTEGELLARMVEAYHSTLLVGTPTFLKGILQAARGTQLETLRTAVTGAEKFPDALFDEVARRCPKLKVVEGYGITECSPVVSGNDKDAPRRGSIGRLLRTFEHAVVHPETGERVATGGRGLLLLRGPAVFSGYLNHDGPQPFVEFEGKTWYPTGDLVVEDADGVLTFAGRVKRFVKLGGEMISLPAVEEALAARFTPPDAEGPAVAVEALSADVQPELVLFTTLDLEREDANRALRDAGLSPLHFVRRVVKVESIPVLGTGKTNYRALKGMV
ncbi:MAG: AMP-binding protein [Acidobacteria bacterium]|nr:AMP-binding protein [Acidobacteriota bacterium]